MNIKMKSAMKCGLIQRETDGYTVLLRRSMVTVGVSKWCRYVFEITTVRNRELAAAEKPTSFLRRQESSLSTTLIPAYAGMTILFNDFKTCFQRCALCGTVVFGNNTSNFECT